MKTAIQWINFYKNRYKQKEWQFWEFAPNFNVECPTNGDELVWLWINM